jgi:hypothetical protein
MPFRNWRLIPFLLLLAAISGCALWHELQPHRLHRLNRGPAPALDPEFSQADPMPTDERILRAQNADPSVADGRL